jgi:TolB-like protein/DNA-binding winged helix-turn-helix (wHTH) protein
MPERYWIVGPIRLDLHDERVWRSGKQVKLGRKAFALLVRLMRTPEMLVSKDSLFDDVWDGLAVSDSVLTTAVKELRQALGDDARKPSLIETVHRRGYRFMLPVDRSNSPEPTVTVTEAKVPPQRWYAGLLALVLAAIALGGWHILGQGKVVPVADPKSIAVLPFRDLSAGMENIWFANGLTEEVRARLARTPDIQVVSRLAVGSSGNGSATERARILGVAHILDGSVRHSKGRVRVTIDLVRAADGKQLWTQSYDHPLTDVIPIQEDIAYRIATSLKTAMNPAKLRAMVSAGTRSVEAYRAFLQGIAESKRALDTGGREHVLAAAAAYERARIHDPDFAEAHWRAAQNWFGKSTRINGIIYGEKLSNADRKAEYLLRVNRAIATSANEVDRLKYISARSVAEMELHRAHRLMVEYLAARPRDIDAWEDMAELASFANQQEWLIRSGERIHTLSLKDNAPRSRAITVTTMAMQLPDAIARAREQLQLQPNSVMTRYQAHRALIWGGKTAEARRSLYRIISSNLPAENKLLAQLRQACAENQIGDARATQQRLNTLPNLSLSGRWQAAEIMGQHQAASALLRPLDNPEDLPELMEFMLNPNFDSSAYPLLRSMLASDGVVRSKIWPMPRACKAS